VLQALLSGGKFANGARTAAFLVTLRELPSLYEEYVGYELDAGPGGNPAPKDELTPPVKGANNVGIQGGRLDAQGRPVNCGALCLREGGPLSRGLNRVFGVNATAGVHDNMQISLGTGLAREALNFPLMVPAAAFTYSAILGQPLQLLTNQQLIYLSASNGFDRDDSRRYVYAAGAIGMH
jgi:hypothetical protein